MRYKWMAGVTALVLVSALSACGSSEDSSDPTATTTTKAPDVSQHQSGPESPIAYGLQVPKGATQLGPLVRYRSDALIAAYKPQLDAAIAQKAADDAAKQQKDIESGKNPSPATPTTPAPPPVPKPTDDTFKLLGDDAPKPDTTVSLMRVDSDPSDVTVRMISQIAAILPKAGIKKRVLTPYCTVIKDRVSGCFMSVRGKTGGGREIRVTMTVDPGNITTRTSAPSAETKPVMTLQVEYVGEPREGQTGKDTDGIGDLPSNDLKALPNTLVWPKMDADAPGTIALLDGKWKAPEGTNLLLSGFHPGFVAMNTVKGKQADLIAEEYVRSAADKGVFTKDVVADLNEVSTTYTAERADGVRAFGSYILSARGTYAMLFYLPKPTV